MTPPRTAGADATRDANLGPSSAQGPMELSATGKKQKPKPRQSTSHTRGRKLYVSTKTIRALPSSALVSSEMTMNLQPWRILCPRLSRHQHADTGRPEGARPPEGTPRHRVGDKGTAAPQEQGWLCRSSPPSRPGRPSSSSRHCCPGAAATTAGGASPTTKLPANKMAVGPARHGWHPAPAPRPAAPQGLLLLSISAPAYQRPPGAGKRRAPSAPLRRRPWCGCPGAGAAPGGVFSSRLHKDGPEEARVLCTAPLQRTGPQIIIRALNVNVSSVRLLSSDCHASVGPQIGDRWRAARLCWLPPLPGPATGLRLCSQIPPSSSCRKRSETPSSLRRATADRQQYVLARSRRGLDHLWLHRSNAAQWKWGER